MSNPPKRVAWFITGHGYGHGVRSSVIINMLSPDIEVNIFTSLPEQFFAEELTHSYHYFPCEIDCGCVQFDTVKIDIPATLNKYKLLDRHRDKLITETVKILEQLQIDLVIADIPPLAFPIAHQAHIPSLAIFNFTWADIYYPYTLHYAEYTRLLEQIRADYRLAQYALYLWPGLKNLDFQQIESIGLLFRQGTSRRDVIARRVKMNPQKKWCLVYVGSYGLEGVAWEKLEHFEEYEFFGLYPLAKAPKNYHLIVKHANYNYADLTASADVVLGKLGYGLVSECLGLGKPVLFISREDFIEYEALKQPLLERQQGIEMTPGELKAVEFCPHLETLTARSYLPVMENGLATVVAYIEGLLFPPCHSERRAS